MRWTLKPKTEEEALAPLIRSLNVTPLVAQLLFQRGITNYEEAKKFFRPELSDLHDPFLMKDMDAAVARIELAISRNENILVFGDYDVDGTTAVALVSSYLLQFNSNVATYIPDRYIEGYGISYQGIDYAADNNISLIIALDCGIKAIEKVAYARKLDIDFIICDHHRPGAQLPEAIAVLDPKRVDCSYPYKELCGCGIGFKLIQALATRRQVSVEELWPYLDLVATAIGADIVPITGENRILAYFGLKVINECPRVGFQAILNQINKKVLTITDLVFIIAPRINAAGRIKHGQHAVDLLTVNDVQQAADFAAGIERFNTERKGLDQEITLEALQQIRANEEEDRHTTVVYKESWHKGVIGIVASRLIETYYRPTLVFTKSGDKLAASARSVNGFDIYEALEECSETIEQFGGHKYAAGLTLLETQFEHFKKQFEEVVARRMDPVMLTRELKIDAMVELRDLNPKLLRILDQFAPFGPGNMPPVFMAGELTDTGLAKTVGSGDLHLKMNVIQPGSAPVGAIGFNIGHKLDLAANKKKFSAVFSIEENEWQGKRSLQLKLKDIAAH